MRGLQSLGPALDSARRVGEDGSQRALRRRPGARHQAPVARRPSGWHGVRVQGLQGWPLEGVQGTVPGRPQEVRAAFPAEPVGQAPQGLASLL